MRIIDVDGLFNVRAFDGDAPWLIRSGAPEGLTARGAQHLRDLGLEAILDLREPDESPAGAHGFPVRPVALYGTRPPQTGRLEDVYAALLRDRGAAVTAAVGVIADADGAVLVHCTAGKDRTGLVVALARLAGGATRAEVIADYALSGAQVRPARLAHADEIATLVPERERDDVLRLHLDSPTEAIQHALDVLDELGGADAYLAGHGLRPDQFAALRTKATR